MLAAIRTCLEDRKAKDVRVLDIGERSGFADYFVLATGTSARHVASIADHVREELKHAGYPAGASEGEETGDWILLDMGPVVVHVMRAETRAFYNLEELWTDILSGSVGDEAGRDPDDAS
jgi:ribosome-associated protein